MAYSTFDFLVPSPLISHPCLLSDWVTSYRSSRRLGLGNPLLPMPSLSFIKPKAPKWKAIVSHRTPFPAGRFDNPNSPHPYASPDIIDIHDNTASSDSVPAPEPPPKPTIPRQPSPHIQIDIDLSSEPFDSDWFQTQFTASPSPLQQQQIVQGVDGNQVAVGGSPALGVTERWEPRGVPNEGPTDDDDDDIDISTSEDDVLDHLRAMDVSVACGTVTNLIIYLLGVNVSRPLSSIKPGMPVLLSTEDLQLNPLGRWLSHPSRRPRGGTLLLPSKSQACTCMVPKSRLFVLRRQTTLAPSQKYPLPNPLLYLVKLSLARY